MLLKRHMQMFSVHGCIDLCVCRYRFVVHGTLKRYQLPSSPTRLSWRRHAQKSKTGIFPENGGLPKSLMVLARHTWWGECQGCGNLWFLALWEEPSPGHQRRLSAMLLRQCRLCEEVGHLPHPHWVWFPPSSLLCDGNGNDDTIHKCQKNFCPHPNEN